MKIYTSGNIKVEYSGTVIYKDCFVGENSIHSLISDFRANSIDFSEIYGCFSIVIHNVIDDSFIFFCDNMGYMPIYYTDTGTPVFSRSLIDITERTRQTDKDIDWNAVFSFLEFGFCHSNLTFFKNIKKCSGDCIYKIKNECIHITQKECKYKDIKNIDDYTELLKKVLSAFRKEKVIFDITGGTDSRLLVCLAESIGLNYELFVRGHSRAIDIKIAKEIAALLNKPIHVMEAKAFDEFTDESFLKLFAELDGVYIPLEGFQLLEAYKNRQHNGCTYNIGGLGGEYYKTFWIMRNKKLNGSYTNAVIMRKKINVNVLSEAIRNLYDVYDKNLVSRLLIEDCNKLKTYLNWYRKHFFSRRSGVLYSFSSNYTSAYSPLAEEVFNSWIQNMPIVYRVFKMFYRKIMGKNCPLLTSLLTNTGESLSLKPLKLCRDAFILFFRSFIRIFSRIFTGKMYSSDRESVSACTDYILLRNSSFLENVSIFFKENNVLNKNIDFSNMSIEDIDRYLVIWFWLRKLVLS